MHIPHTPVLLRETLDLLAPKAHGRYLDGTVGLGGHAHAILTSAPGIELCGLDRDREALEIAARRLAPFGDAVRLFHLRYSQYTEALASLGWEKIDGALIDVGVSSLQLDSAARGFSYNSDGPLDMRMDQTGQTDGGNNGTSAWHIVNRERFEVLKDCITALGEDPQAGRIARAIVDARQSGPIDTTTQLADIVRRAYPAAWRAKARNHPATRTFQALRMAVNNELGELSQFLEGIVDRLVVGGRLVVLSFHSLEDRKVKHALRTKAESCRCPRHIMRCVCGNIPHIHILTKKPLTPGLEELTANPRAASAKLRAAERCAGADV